MSQNDSKLKNIDEIIADDYGTEEFVDDSASSTGESASTNSANGTTHTVKLDDYDWSALNIFDLKSSHVPYVSSTQIGTLSSTPQVDVAFAKPSSCTAYSLSDQTIEVLDNLVKHYMDEMRDDIVKQIVQQLKLEK